MIANYPNMYAVVHERVRSLMEDGYILMFRSTSLTVGFYKLRHRFNGHTVIVRAYYCRNRLQQYRDDRLVHDSEIWTQ